MFRYCCNYTARRQVKPATRFPPLAKAQGFPTRFPMKIQLTCLLKAGR
jgi:hypothetical protein